MAAELRVLHAVHLTIDGETQPDFGSISVPVKGVVASITTGKTPIRKRVKVPAGSQVTVWLWADTSGFEYMELRPTHAPGGAAEGFIQFACRYNSPTSSSDLTPTGSTNHWKEISRSCVAPLCLDSERAYFHATASNAVAQSGSGTYPGVWAEGAKVLGVCDAVALRNDSTTDYYYDLLVVPK